MANLTIKWVLEAGVEEEDLQKLREVSEELPERMKRLIFLHVEGAQFPLSNILWGELPGHPVAESSEEEEQCGVRQEEFVERSREPEVDELVVDDIAKDGREVLLESAEPDSRNPKRRISARICPICQEEPDHLRRHVLDRHLPYWFVLDCACLDCQRVFVTAKERMTHQRHRHGEVDWLETQHYFDWLESMDFLLVKLMLSTSCASLKELPSKFHRRGWLPQHGERWNISMEVMLRDLSRYITWNGLEAIQESQTLSPGSPHHPVEILYWYSLMNAMASLSESQRNDIRDLKFLRSDRVPGSRIVSPELEFPTAIDSHCHLGSWLFGNSLRDSWEEAKEQHGYDAPYLSVIVDNRVFRDEWNTPSLSWIGASKLGEVDPPTIKVAWGIHPTQRVGGDRLDRLSQEIGEESCVAVGECGLDYVKVHPEDRHRLASQEHLFIQVIRWAKESGKPLILHLRQRQSGMTTVMAAAIRILKKERLPREHRVYIHSFVGSLQDYRYWLRFYPKTVFGVSSVTTSNTRAREFVELADLRRLVVESDAPHMCSNGQSNTPHSIARPAGYIAHCRGLPLRTVYGSTTMVAREFFGI